MEHKYIENNHIADRYVMGKLAEVERDEFEQHFIGCSHCVQMLQEVQIVRRALEIAGPDTSSGFDLRARLSALIRPFTPLQVLTATAAFLVLTALPILFLLNQNSLLKSERDQTVALNRSLNEPLENGRQAITSIGEGDSTPATPNLNHSPTPRPSRVIKSRFGEVARKYDEPIPNTSIFTVHPPSRGPEETEQSINEITVDRSTFNLVLLFELENSTDKASPKREKYRARILSEDGKWRKRINGLRPNNLGTLSITVRSGFFKPGNYKLILEGAIEREYSFKVVRRDVKQSPPDNL